MASKLQIGPAGPGGCFFFDMILHDALPLGVVPSVKTKTNPLIELDGSCIVPVHTQIYRILPIFCTESIKQGKHSLSPIPFVLIPFVNEEPV